MFECRADSSNLMLGRSRTGAHHCAGRPSAPGAAFLPTGAVLVVASLLSGCWEDRNREAGHEDITFGLSQRGDSLVFNATGDGGRDLYLLDLKRNHVTRIAKSQEYEFAPSISPDEKWIAFVARSPGGRGNHIFLQNVDGGNRRQLTSGDRSDTSPSFSPDGSHLVFARSKTYDSGGLAAGWEAGEALQVMKVDGSGLRRINTSGLHVIDPRFSPDGKQVVFWEPSGCYLVDADGSRAPRRVAGVTARQASLALDGRSLLYSAGRYARGQTIFVAGVDGSGVRQIVCGSDLDAVSAAGCDHASFTADGSRVIFLADSWPDGVGGVLKRSLWEVKIDGTQPRKLANYELFDDPLAYFSGRN
jgi:Tol biopolymer transport system component